MTYEEWLGVLSVVMLVMFIGIFAWAFSPSRKAKFDEAARTPLDDDALERDFAATKRDNNETGEP
ncbi:MAG: cbb3-type cytochrome oxidase subunit 3 [Litorivicinus sp.]